MKTRNTVTEEKLENKRQELREAVEILKLVKDSAPINLLPVINEFILRNGG